ncbi:jmjC domain, hydroxylase domain-containing protein [Ditylenchus destructor]|uniref:JmjC domain, hydroxylase domain-containing protein n=1 Tax=Ditylenchus destructor TaxID=166010 RepID=A0AAD4NCE7_9BILA|nr:jmjC domain, hydroxylase domain-containing protein [Ditylenchus destructor]
MAAQNIVYSKDQEWVNTGTKDIMVFHPTMEEFQDFSGLIRKIEQQGAHWASGICKIIPPKEWNPRPSRSNYDDAEAYTIKCPVKEKIEGSSGNYTKELKVHRKKMSVADFKQIALSKEMSNPKPDITLSELERHYWRNITFGEPIYGADTPGTLYDPDVKHFNMKQLGTILDLLKENKIKIHGVNTVFLYFGMWKTTFPWHAEDMDLYSINYLHYGEPKFWYSIPTQAAEKFERLASQQFADAPHICKAFLRHKIYIISPSVLRTHSIPFGTMVQYPNEFIITFPKGYHMGFNTGYNCAESTNFALERWIDFGKNASICHCRPDKVEINMSPFMQKYRPEEYEEWFDYWYGERHSALGPRKKKSKKSMTPEIKSQEMTFHDPTLAQRTSRIARAKQNVKELWSDLPVNLFIEKEYNRKRGELYPHCSVCQYFTPKYLVKKGNGSQKSPDGAITPSNGKLPERSFRFVRTQLFHKERELDKPGTGDSEEDELLECENCRIVVHRHCYPEIMEQRPSTSDKPNQPDSWLCERCFNRGDITIRAASCKLCELRGGALIESKDCSGVLSFVHVICAIMDPNTRFLEPWKRHKPFCTPPKRLGIVPADNIDKFIFNCAAGNVLTKTEAEPTTSQSESDSSTSPSKLSRRGSSGQLSARFECESCERISDSLIRCDVCVANDEPGASLRYHITCAALVEMSFERRDFPETAVVICPFHSNQQAIKQPDTRDIQIGERVFVSLENCMDDKAPGGKLVKKGRVIGTSECLYCAVDFLDGTVSTDLFPSDIKDCECKKIGCKGNHLPGAVAYYRGKAPVKKYTVELDTILSDDSDPKKNIVEITEDNVYQQGEPLPEDVRLALLKRPSTEK